ncbi:MAG TPA: DUF2516 family protein [Mycobacteriales bacterium]|nr:DUF2516 family protein [Mycobacteriales bacterium]
MHYLFHPASGLLLLVSVGLTVLKVWALVDCATRPAAAFPVHGKLSKVAWLVILALGLLLGWGIGLLGLAAAVAAIVYLVDVRPAVSGQSL